MAKATRKPDKADQAEKFGRDPTDRGYKAWKKAKIAATVKRADKRPDDVRTHEDVFDGLRQKFRP